MKIVGIVAEYNPFHNGHLYHIKKTKESIDADAIIVVMSGNFTQRGEPAIYDKWARTEMALKNGVDLVLELPFIYACNSAEYFAAGAIDILDGLGIVDYLSFGSESGSIEELNLLSDIFISEEDKLKGAIKQGLKSGLSYPKSLDGAFKEIYPDLYDKISLSPNNTLALEYIKRLKSINSKIKPFAVKRQGAGYNDINIYEGFASATGIRQRLIDVDMNFLTRSLPANVLDMTQSKKTTLFDQFYELIVFKILNTDLDALRDNPHISEGLEYKIKKSVYTCNNLETLIGNIKSKRYTKTRVQRLILNMLISTKKSDLSDVLNNQTKAYGRILGFSETGRQLIRKIKRESLNTVPIIDKISDKEINKNLNISFLKYDILASDIYNLINNSENNTLFSNSDYMQKPVCNCSKKHV